MRRLSTGIAIAGLLNPIGAHALGVGDIRVQSYLNQMLRAEIPLVLSQEKLSDIKIQLAPAKDFAAAGLERSSILTKLRFDPVQEPGGGFVIRVGSSESIHDPFLNFLLEFTWPEGRIVRNFTVLLDPPEVLAQASAPLRSDRTVEDDSHPAPSLPLAAAVETAADYGPVGRNEKLWTIAGKLNQEPAITQEQMVIALFRFNPQAFSRPSVNALNAGAVLRVPPRDYILQLSPSLAREEFFRQQAGRSPRWLQESTPPSGLGDPSSGEGTTSGTRRADPTPPAPSRVRQAPGGIQSDVGLRALEALQRDNADLRTRLTELERRIAELQVLFAEKEILASAGQPAAIVDRKPPGDTDSIRAKGLVAQAPVPAIPAPGPLPITGVVPQSASAPPAATRANEAQTAPPLAAPRSPEANVASTGAGLQAVAPGHSNNPLESWLLAGGGAVLGAALTWLYGRRPRSASSLDDDKGDGGTLATAQSMDTERVAEPDPIASGEPSLPTMDAEDVDPLFEADIYLSYGKHGQALEAIQNALRHQPECETFRLKLLEIHLIGGDAGQFEQEIRALQAITPAPAQSFWDRVAELAARMDAEALLDRALGIPARNPANREPDIDETDRLIEDLKQFSREMRNGTSPGSADALDSSAPEQLDGPEQETVASLDPHEIPWIPVARADGSEPVDSAGAPRPSGLESAPTATPETFETLASESIDSLLKELSALHYERHCQQDQQPAVSPAEQEPDGPDQTAATGETAPRQPSASGSPAEAASNAGEGTPDELETKLDLARAYADMGDHQQAREFLSEVMERGSEAQKAEAAGLLASLAGV